MEKIKETKRRLIGEVETVKAVREMGEHVQVIVQGKVVDELDIVNPSLWMNNNEIFYRYVELQYDNYNVKYAKKLGDKVVLDLEKGKKIEFKKLNKKYFKVDEMKAKVMELSHKGELLVTEEIESIVTGIFEGTTHTVLISFNDGDRIVVSVVNRVNIRHWL